LSEPGLLQGIVAKAWSDWYDVETPAGRLRCQPRGRLRLTWQSRSRARPTEGERALAAILVGDLVQVRPRPGGEGAIEAVLPRRTALSRPLVANVDRVLVVAAWREPPWNGELVDRLLVLAGAHGCEGWLVLNKVDQLEPPDAAEERLAVYAAAGYRVWRVSAARGDGVGELADALGDGVAVLAGASGVGKSRLLAALVPERAASIRTGEVSPRLLRGRHTTRHAELLRLPGGGFVADTPGFSRADLAHVGKADLAALFPEIAARAAGCRFRGCLHRGEPGCAVPGAVDAERLRHYRLFLAEVEAWEAKRY
jgi:ribosome biogenesis GTPase